MADNTEEEHLDNPANVQSENTSDDITPVTETETISQNQEIENMEVHHHPDLHHKPKKWKEYFLEFLMIFLAVTLGFFAESIREKINNKEHAKILTERLVKDMHTDTLNLQQVISFEQYELRTIDTLFLLLQQPISSADTKSIQQLICNCYTMQSFTPSTSAIQAIERELNISQFSNSELPGLMAFYKETADLNKENEQIFVKLAEVSLEAFIYAHFMPSNAYSALGKNGLIVDSKMRNLTQEDMTKLSIQIETMANVITQIISNDVFLKKQAVEIIEYTKKQYHLENT